MRNLAGFTATPGVPPPINEPFAWREKRYEAVWPRWVENNVVRGFERERVRSLASGYVLVRFGTDIEWHDVRERCGVGARFIGEPDPVPEDEVARLLRDALTPDGVLPARSDVKALYDLQPGDIVLMLLPAWEGQRARVVWADNMGAKIELGLFGGAAQPLWFPYAAGAFEPADKATVGAISRRQATKAPQYGRRALA